MRIFTLDKCLVLYLICECGVSISRREQFPLTDLRAAAYQETSVNALPVIRRRFNRLTIMNYLNYRVLQQTILGFLDRSRYYFFQVAPQLYSRG
jgi:hypothetical protein